MLSGPWGSGKTHLVKKCLSVPSDSVLYVSLYGISSLEEINNKLFSAMTSLKGVSTEGFEKTGSFLSNVVNVFSDLGDSKSSAIGAIASTIGSTVKDRILRGLKSATIIFDDLERTVMKPSEALSCVNEFVEHQGLNAIVLTDESKICDEDYKSFKEKIILYTYKIERTSKELVDIAFSEFSGFPEDLKESSKRELLGILENIECKNLRTIKLAISCYEKLLRSLKYNGHRKADSKELTSLLFPCFSYAIGHREYEVSDGDLEKFAINEMEMGVKAHLSKSKGGGDEEEKDWKKFYDKVLCKWNGSVQVLSVYRLVCLGYLDYESLKIHVDKWEPAKDNYKKNIVSFNYNLDNSEFENSIQNVIEGIRNKSLELDGSQELIRLIQHLHYLVRNGATDYNLSTLESEITDYVEYVLLNKLYGHTQVDRGVDSADPEFVKDIAKHISDKTREDQKVLEKEVLQNTLLTAISSDSTSEAYSLIYRQSTKPFIFPELIPGLIEALKEATPAQIHDIRQWFGKRYDSSNIFDFLGDEIPALENLACKLKHLVENSSPSLSIFMMGQLARYIESILATQKHKNTR